MPVRNRIFRSATGSSTMPRVIPMSENSTGSISQTLLSGQERRALLSLSQRRRPRRWGTTLQRRHDSRWAFMTMPWSCSFAIEQPGGEPIHAYGRRPSCRSPICWRTKTTFPFVLERKADYLSLLRLAVLESCERPTVCGTPRYLSGCWWYLSLHFLIGEYAQAGWSAAVAVR